MNTIDKNEVKKDLYRTKVDATLMHYDKGNLFYQVDVQFYNAVFQFPVAVVKNTTEKLSIPTAEGTLEQDVNVLRLAKDVDGVFFAPTMPARLLNRWIERAIDNGEFELLLSRDLPHEVEE